MEILINNLYRNQQSLEETLKLETTPEEVEETDYGRHLLKYIKRRHRIINRVIKILRKI